MEYTAYQEMCLHLISERPEGVTAFEIFEWAGEEFNVYDELAPLEHEGVIFRLIFASKEIWRLEFLSPENRWRLKEEYLRHQRTETISADRALIARVLQAFKGHDHRGMWLIEAEMFLWELIDYPRLVYAEDEQDNSQIA